MVTALPGARAIKVIAAQLLSQLSSDQEVFVSIWEAFLMMNPWLDTLVLCMLLAAALQSF